MFGHKFTYPKETARFGNNAPRRKPWKALSKQELKLGKKTTNLISPLVKEWSDMLLFANYKTLSVAVDKDGKKHKAQGGKRVMYTAHHPCWDAKNRYGLPEDFVNGVLVGAWEQVFKAIAEMMNDNYPF